MTRQYDINPQDQEKAENFFRGISMGAFIARQPNGLLCRWSSVVDNITHYNMTEEEYIEYRAEEAREKARWELENTPRFIHSFSEILEKRDEDLVQQCLSVIENPEDYTAKEIEDARADMVRLQSVFDTLVELMSKED
ncbi:MAG: hypothetical protein HDR79_07740 [Bacteroides sp.]|nr:hypothetical protein [Bacteroides sp.]MBD5364816.1 hypothetical protein [Bacteroides sp.]